ncbi:flagellin [Balneatrix alpica]|uniref:Flagellin n=1 Tax=Balneatrix alpica TaxID=75684 RepID=A0ABV5ZCS9_9GAMM|nr:flagellin [Balneatrix alpica]
MINSTSSNSSSLLSSLQQQQEQLQQKLASGKRINRAADDAAGLQIAGRLSTTEVEAKGRANNALDQRNLNSIQEGRLNAISENLVRAQELLVQAGNPLYAGSNAIQQELDAVSETVNVIAKEALGQDNFLSGLNAGDPDTSLATLNSAADTVNNEATRLGAESNTLQRQANTYELVAVNTAASRQRVEETDYAQASSERSANDVLLQSSLRVEQSRQQQQGLLIDTLI